MGSLRDGAGQRRYESVYFVFFVTSAALVLLSYYHKEKKRKTRKEEKCNCLSRPSLNNFITLLILDSLH